MKTLVWTAPRVMEVQQHPQPHIQPDEVLIKVVYAGICGSELSGYLGHNALRVPPLVMGHEFSGEIVAMGDQANAIKPDLRVGARVTVNPLYCTEPSEFQQRGLDHLCPSRRLIGAHRPGAYAEYVAVPAQSVTVLPDGVSFRDGALAEPVGCAVRIGELAGAVTDEDCLVIGAGPIGLLALQVLRLNGANRVFIADLDQERLKMGEALGGTVIDPNTADVVETIREATHKRGVVVSVDAVGAAVTRKQCISATMPTGVVILSGLHEETSPIPAADVIRREVTLRGAFAYSPQNFAQAVILLEAGKIRLSPWVIEAPLEDGGKWFDRLIDHPGAVAKVLLVP